MTRRKILVLDDEALIGLAFADDLEDEGYEVMGPFTRLEEAEKALEEEAPAAAFLDVNLGEGKTSLPLADKLTEKGVPFVFLTGYSELSPMAERFSDASYLSKPVSKDMAIAELRRLTNHV